MRKSFKIFIKSFKLNRMHFFSFIIDIFTIIIPWFLFSWFTKASNAKAESLPGGIITPEQAQKMMTAAPEQLQNYFAHVQSYLLFFLIGFVAILLFSFLLLSLSRATVWTTFLREKLTMKKFWRWCGLHIILILPLVLFLIIYAIIKIGVGAVVSTLAISITPVILNIIDILFFVAILSYFFSVYIGFTKSNLVWNSVGNAFSPVRKQMFALILLPSLVLILLLLLLLPFKNYFFLYPSKQLYTYGILLLLFITWMRLYTFKVIHHEHKHHHGHKHHHEHKQPRQEQHY